MLTRKQKQLHDFISSYQFHNDGVSPSFDEMKDAMNLKSKSGIHRLLDALEERGFIRRHRGRARAIAVLSPSSPVACKCPHCGGALIGPAQATTGMVA